MCWYMLLEKNATKNVALVRDFLNICQKVRTGPLFTGSWPVMSCQPASIHYGQLTHGYITHTQCCTPRNMSFSQRRGEWGGYSRQADRKKKEIVKEGIFIVVPLPTTCNMGNMNEERTGSPS